MGGFRRSVIKDQDVTISAIEDKRVGLIDVLETSRKCMKGYQHGKINPYIN
jgi:uncharacterized membrane protein